MTTPTTPDKSAPEKGMDYDVEIVLKGLKYHNVAAYRNDAKEALKVIEARLIAGLESATRCTPAQETGQQDAEKAEALAAFKRVKVYIDESLRQAAPFLQNLIKKLKGDVDLIERALSAEKNYVGEEPRFHAVMMHLLNMRLDHGLCQPRERRACTHCNAKDDLEKMIDAYVGPRVVVSAPSEPTISLKQLKAICEGMKQAEHKWTDTTHQQTSKQSCNRTLDQVYEAAEKEVRNG